MQKLQEQLQDFLKNISLMQSSRKNPNWRFCCFEEMLLHHGIFMESRTFPEELKGVPAHCYYNCHQIIRKKEYQDLIYVEGYAIAPNVCFPVNHAWLMDSDGYALDPTWREPGLVYFGVPLSNDWVKNFLKSSRKDELSIFKGNYLEEDSLLQHGLPDEALADIPVKG